MGERLTTYNLEVAGSHTYFVGADGVWVHNACNLGRFGDQFSGALERFLKDKTPTEAMKAAILSHPKITASGVKIVTQVQWATDKFYVMLKTGAKGADGKVIVSRGHDIPTVAECNSVCGTGAGGQFRALKGPNGEKMFSKDGYHVHHAVAKFWKKAVERMCPGKTWIDDDVPALLLEGPEHLKPNGLHAIFDDLLIGEKNMELYQNASHLPKFLERVQEAYITANKSEAGEAVIKWFSEIGVK